FLKERIQKSEAHQDRLQNLANRDPLTNLFNRRRINEALEQLVTQQAPFTIIILDVDDFKQINDILGHDAGDRVLIYFANGLRAAVRKDDLIGRWGGDEFILVCPALDDQQTCLIVERLDRIGEQSEADDIPGFRTSHGVATYRPDDSVDTLLKRADNELYAQKRKKAAVRAEAA
ncbi:MAG: GGDEF domain-containing protein, partial [Chloroflexi bacterium]|nr:GGDEF domain-containing protein [Chloroflexota bacterium]